MKTTQHSEFGVGRAAENMSRTKGSDAKSQAASPRVFIEFEIVKNLVAGSNIGLGEVLVYGALNDQAETNV